MKLPIERRKAAKVSRVWQCSCSKNRRRDKLLQLTRTADGVKFLPPGALRLPCGNDVATLRAMLVSWNEIRHNAIKFSRDWTGAKIESAEKQTFWNEFFQVFGVS